MIRLRPLLLSLVCATWGFLACPVAAQDALRPLSIGNSIGLRRLASGHWGIVGIKVSNPSETDRSLQAEAFIEGYPERRFARDVWVPAGGIRMAWIPIHVPDGLDGERALTVVGRVVGEAANAQPLTTLIPQGPPHQATALVRNSPAGSPPDEPAAEDPAYEAVLAMRAARGLKRTLAMSLQERLLPPTLEGWDPVDQIVIAGDHLADDSAGQLAVRHWLARGGRIWLQLNRTSLETAERLLGDAFQVELVDRVPLTRFQIETVSFDRQVLSPEIAAEEPVELMRVLVEEAEIVHAVNDWPASFVIPFGHGEVIVTTLDAHGWMRPRGPADGMFDDPLRYTKYVATDPMYALAERIFDPPEPPGLPASLQAEYLTERIGYQVPDRGLVLTILLGFCGAIAVLGIVLIRRERLEHLAWVTTLVAVVLAVVIVSMGWWQRQAVAPTAAQLQTARILPATNEFVASGTIARYSPDQRAVALESPAGWQIDPSMPDLSGQIRRFLWTDLNAWQWKGTNIPPGVQLLPTDAVASLPEPVHASGQFGPEGFTGRLEAGAFGEVSDGLVISPLAPPLAANLQADGEFLATPNDRLVEGQFLSETLLSDEQRRRQDLYAAWFASQQQAGTAPGLLLTAWAGPIEGAFRWPVGVQTNGTTLLTVPLRVERTPPDTPIKIPASLIGMKTVAGPSGSSQAFENKTRQWIGPIVQTTDTRLRFQMPAAVLPMRIEQATLTLNCNIPSRELKVFAASADPRQLLFERSSPSGRVTIRIDDPAALGLDEEGGLLLDIVVGELTREVEMQTIANSGWAIESTHLDVVGRTLATANSPAATDD